jgi:hypothetical protein
MFATNNQNQQDMSYYNNLKPLWANQTLKEEDEENGQDIPYGLSNAETWKVVGSPPRRMSISGLQQQMIDDKAAAASKNLLTVEDYEELKRRNRAASTPVPPLGLGNDLFSYPFSPVDNKTEEATDNYYALQAQAQAQALKQQQQQQQQKQWNDRIYSPSQNNVSFWNQEMALKSNVNANSITEEERAEMSEKSSSYAMNNNSHPSTPVALPTPPLVTITNTDTTSAPTITTPLNISSLPSTPESQPAQSTGNMESNEVNSIKESLINDEKEVLPTQKQRPAIGKIRINTNFNRDGKLESLDNNELHGRKFRSSSFSVGSFNAQQLQPTIQETDENQMNKQDMNNYLKPNNLEMSPLNNLQQNALLSSLNYDLPKSRTRSKSSSDVYGNYSDQNLANLLNNGLDLNGANNYAAALSGMNSPLWRNNNYNLLQALMANSRNGPASASLINSMSQMSSLMGNDFSNLHHRSATQPTYSNLWGTSGSANGTVDANVNIPTSPLSPTMQSVSSIITSPVLSPNHVNMNNNNAMLSPQSNYFQNTTVAPNFSLASPTTSQSAGIGYNQHRYGSINEEALKNDETMRKNSLTNSNLYNTLMTTNSGGMNNNNNGGGEASSSNDDAKNKALSNQGSDYVNEIDDYFENTEHRTRAWVEAGKNLQNQQSSQHWPLYIVEFKAGRTDYFYISEKSGLVVKVNDLVIVEADRGKDLGKVVASNITSFQQIQAYQAQHAEDGMEIQKDMQIHPKRIYRLAQKAEIDMLIAKCQDEVKSKNLCQSKVRQKKLPMEIVDAEFQWDRKKLTFYFVSDRRIDFRELVRELFKIYKTRIWMCAVSSIPN